MVVSQTARMTQNTFIYSTLIDCPLYANVELFMILVDVSMQTRIGVVDEVAKFVEHVEIDIVKSSTMTSSITVSAAMPCPVGNVTHDGLYGSRWDLCGPKDMVVKEYCYRVSRSSGELRQGIWSQVRSDVFHTHESVICSSPSRI